MPQQEPQQTPVKTPQETPESPPLPEQPKDVPSPREEPQGFPKKTVVQEVPEQIEPTRKESVPIPPDDIPIPAQEPAVQSEQVDDNGRTGAHYPYPTGTTITTTTMKPPHTSHHPYPSGTTVTTTRPHYPLPPGHPGPRPPYLPPPGHGHPIPPDWYHKPPVHVPPHWVSRPPSHDYDLDYWKYSWRDHKPPHRDVKDATYVKVHVEIDIHTGTPVFYSNADVVVKVMDHDRPGHFLEFPVGPGRPHIPQNNWCGSGGYNWAAVSVSAPNTQVFAGAGSYRPDNHCGRPWDGRRDHQESLQVGVWVQVYVNQPPIYVRDVQDCGDHIIVNRTTFIYGSKAPQLYQGQPLWIPRAEKPYTVNPLSPASYTSEVPAVFEGYTSGDNPTMTAQSSPIADYRLQYAVAAGFAVMVIGGIIALVIYRRLRPSNE